MQVVAIYMCIIQDATHIILWNQDANEEDIGTCFILSKQKLSSMAMFLRNYNKRCGGMQFQYSLEYKAV